MTTVSLWLAAVSGQFFLVACEGKGGEGERKLSGFEQEVERLTHQLAAGGGIKARDCQDLVGHARLVGAGGHQPAVVLDNVQDLAEEFDAADRDV